ILKIQRGSTSRKRGSIRNGMGGQRRQEYSDSPIWLHTPAPPVFEFVRNNDFTGKTVILFNSLNSKFEQKYIDQFSDLVNAQGGRVIKHIYVIRGRMTR